MVIDISNIVFTRCKVALEEYFGENGIVVGSTESDMDEVFPACLIKQIGSPSIGSSFSNTQLAVVSTIEVQSYSIESVQEAKNIIAICADTLAIMNYALITGPEEVSNGTDLRRFVARFRRTVGSGDAIKIF